MAIDPDVQSLLTISDARLDALEARVQPDVGTRYVLITGDDNDDGLTWGTALLTVAAAIADLPTIGSGGTLAHTGTVRVGPGVFVEANPLEVNNSLSIIGNGTGLPSAAGTEIQGSNDAHLFAPTGSYTDYSHNVLFKDLRLSGVGITGGYDLIQLLRGGFNTRIENVAFRDSPRGGVRFLENAITALVSGCTWVRMGEDAIYFHANGGLANLQIVHSEADELARSFLYIDHTSAGQGNSVHVDGLKAESTSGQDRVIQLVPRPAGGGDPVYMDISNVMAAAVNGSSVVYEADNPGAASIWSLRNVNGQGYQRAFQSEKTGQQSQAAGLRTGWFADPEEWNYDSPVLELQGISVDVGDSIPALNRPTGSLYLQRGGGLYVREATGWVIK